MTDENVSRSPRTVAVTAGRPNNDNDPLNASIVMASNFQDSGDYARTHGTSTWAALETAVGALEGGQCLSFATGMAEALEVSEGAVKFHLHQARQKLRAHIEAREET